MITLDERTEELARRLAEQSGQTPADMIRQLLEERARERGLTGASGHRRPNYERMREIAKRISSMPVLDDRSADDIIGYDEIGVPR